MNGIGYGITPFMGTSGILARSSGGGGGAFVNEYSMSFDGVDERFAVGTTSLGITSAISVSAWVKIPTTNTGGPSNRQQIICEDTTTAGQRNWNLLWRGTGFNYFQWVVWHTDLSATSITSTGVVPNDGFWHHVMGTYDGTSGANGMKLYIDGVLNAQGTAGSTGINSFTSTEPTIGKLTTSNDRYFEGNIDEVAIWNSDQNTNASTIYNGGAPADLSSLSPLSWWRMGDGDTWNGSTWTLTDNGSGGNDATSVNMEEADRVTDVPPSVWSNQYSMSFDGVDEYFNGASTFSELDGQNKATFSMWVKPTSFSVGRILFSITKNTTVGNCQVMMFVDTSARLRGFVSTTGTYIYSNASVLTLNTWHHILFCIDLSQSPVANRGRIFVDGIDQTGSGFSQLNLTTLPTSNSELYIGEDKNGYQNPFLNNIDEFAMWVGTDQRANVSDIYNGGVPFDLSTLATAPDHWWRMGDNDTWSGSQWTLSDNIGSYDLTSANMEEADRVTDIP